jgi:vitamin B12 transporter
MEISNLTARIFAAQKERSMKKLAVCIGAVFITMSTLAQNDSTNLDPVTVTATLKSQTASSSGRSITVISGQQFNRLPVQSIDELLKFVPGVEVQQRGPAGSQADIVIRGGTFQQVLVILDGLRLNDPNTGHFSSYIPIAPAEIDHIEVLKGAASAMYGSEAVGGVIHIITKSFAVKNTLSKKLFSLQATGGDYGLWSVNAGGMYQSGNNSLAGGFLLNNADGQSQRGTTGFYNNNTASLSASHYFNDHWRIALRTAYDKRDFSAQNFYTTFKSDTATEKVESFWNQLSLVHHQGKHSWHTDAGYKKVTDQYAFNSGAIANKNISAMLQLASRYTYDLSATTHIITGLQYIHKQIYSNDRGDHQLNQLAGFVMLHQKIAGHFLFSPALRLDHVANLTTELVPQLNASYKKGNLQVRASAGKTIRQSDFTERYNNYNKAFVASGSIGNPNLEAERSFSYEAGADYIFCSNLKVTATAFRRNQSGLVDWVNTSYSEMPRKDNLSSTGSYALARNIASVQISGLESSIEYSRKWAGKKELLATAGLLWLDSKTSSGKPSFYLSSHAKFLANSTIVYTNTWGRLSLATIYKTRQNQAASAIAATVSKEYFLLNAKAEAFLLKQKASFFAQASNLLNKTYSDLLGAPMPGRWLCCGIQYVFK